MQRFGTPSFLTQAGDKVAQRIFGLKSPLVSFRTGVHNVYYTASSHSALLRGKETLCMYANEVEIGSELVQGSVAYEFVFSPVAEGSNEDTGDDSVFDVDSVSVKFSYLSRTAGGARPIGNGVFLGMSGYLVSTINGSGLEVADSSGSAHWMAYRDPTPFALSRVVMYDPFIRVPSVSEVMV